MKVHEIRDLEEARHLLLQGLWLQRSQAPEQTDVDEVLRWCQEIVAADQPLLPPGFIADLGRAAFLLDASTRLPLPSLTFAGWERGLERSYEDQVLGKLYGDYTFERASETLRRYEKPRDRARGLAYVAQQLRERTHCDAVRLNPAIFKPLLQQSAPQILSAGADSLSHGVLPLLVELQKTLIAGFRQLPEVLGPEDLFELEHGIALQGFGQRLALRQVLQAAELLQANLGRHRPPRSSRAEVPTRVLDEDTYPVGGYSSLSTRGSIESLLHSQLAYMEKEERPDLFDIKYLRDELLYYARDENQFLRRRRAFIFLLYPDLLEARFKDAELPFQRIILTLAFLVVLVRRLSEWLNEDALTFEILLLRADRGSEPLAPERELLEMLFREQIISKMLVLDTVAKTDELERRCRMRAQRSLCQCLTVSTAQRRFKVEDVTVSHLRIHDAEPRLTFPQPLLEEPNPPDAVTAWQEMTEGVLRAWL